MAETKSIVDLKTELDEIRTAQAGLATRRAELEKILAPPPLLSEIDAKAAEIDALPADDPTRAEKAEFLAGLRRSVEDMLAKNPPRAGGVAKSIYTLAHIDTRLKVLRNPKSPKPGEGPKGHCRPTDEAEVAREIEYLENLKAKKFPAESN